MDTYDSTDGRVKTAIIMVGLPGSGKSTWIKHNRGSATVVVSSDDILEQLAQARGMTYNEVFNDNIALATDEAMRRAKLAFKANCDVIFDFTHCSKKSRARHLAMIPEDYRKIAIVFDVPGEILTARQSLRPGKKIPYTVMKSMRANYTRPTLDEGFDYIETHIMRVDTIEELRKDALVRKMEDGKEESTGNVAIAALTRGT